MTTTTATARRASAWFGPAAIPVASPCPEPYQYRLGRDVYEEMLAGLPEARRQLIAERGAERARAAANPGPLPRRQPLRTRGPMSGAAAPVADDLAGPDAGRDAGDRAQEASVALLERWGASPGRLSDRDDEPPADEHDISAEEFEAAKVMPPEPEDRLAVAHMSPPRSLAPDGTGHEGPGRQADAGSLPAQPRGDRVPRAEGSPLQNTAMRDRVSRDLGAEGEGCSAVPSIQSGHLDRLGELAAPYAPDDLPRPAGARDAHPVTGSDQLSRPDAGPGQPATEDLPAPDDKSRAETCVESGTGRGQPASEDLSRRGHGARGDPATQDAAALPETDPRRHARTGNDGEAPAPGRPDDTGAVAGVIADPYENGHPGAHPRRWPGPYHGKGRHCA